MKTTTCTPDGTLPYLLSPPNCKPPPIRWLTSKTSESTLNPYNVGQSFYVYGNFPMTVTRFLAEAGESLCQLFAPDEPAQSGLSQIAFTGYDGVHLLGRFLSGLLDLVSVFFIFLIGRRLYDGRIGLLAALLLALAVMSIQQSHFFTMDNWATGLTTLALYAAVRVAGLGDKPVQWRLRWYLLFGLAVGLSLASRINMAPLALMINLSAFIWLVLRGQTWAKIRNTGGGKLDVERVILGIVAAAFVTILTFRLAQPYAFADAAIARQEVLAATGQEPGAPQSCHSLSGGAKSAVPRQHGRNSTAPAARRQLPPGRAVGRPHPDSFPVYEYGAVWHGAAGRVDGLDWLFSGRCGALCGHGRIG
ncbi:MAG: glycosyltransferase family 39 protein [Chloroflexi bacterium]|nr:glycosyltransferase family 39 protein [Chloroflexota bacterium]